MPGSPPQAVPPLACRVSWAWSCSLLVSSGGSPRLWAGLAGGTVSPAASIPVALLFLPSPFWVCIPLRLSSLCDDWSYLREVSTIMGWCRHPDSPGTSWFCTENPMGRLERLVSLVLNRQFLISSCVGREPDCVQGQPGPFLLQGKALLV